jgi:hypothetical protein
VAFVLPSCSEFATDERNRVANFWRARKIAKGDY